MRGWSLLTRFALVAAVLIAALGVILAQVVSRTVQSRALDSAVQAAVLTASVDISPLIGHERLDGPLPEAAAERVDAGLAATFDDGQLARIKVWDAHGRLAYAGDTHGRLDAEADADDDVLEALEGETEGEVISNSDEEGNASMLEKYGTVLEVYVPIRSSSDGAKSSKPLGVFEIYLPYAENQRAVDHDVLRTWLILAAGLLVLFVALFRTVATASRQLRGNTRQLEHDVMHDRLTSLPNNVFLVGLLDDRPVDQDAALLLLDADHFRQINETLGHAHGDEVLREVAARLVSLVGGDGTVARLGSGEFAIFVPEAVGLRDGRVLAERLCEELLAAYVVADVPLVLDMSVGVAPLPAGGAVSGERALRCADRALSSAKATRHSVVVHTADLDDDAGRARLALLGELKAALGAGELVMHYQPKVDLASGRVTGVEALVRWAHPTRGLLPPVEFLPTAEQTGLMRPLTAYVLDLSLGRVAAWRADGEDITVAVNISARSLSDPGFPDSVLDALAEHGLPPSALVLEITESSLMVDPDRALLALHQLHDAGITLSVDDFGTGYASLAYLKMLPVDELKIDRTFVGNLAHDLRDGHIVESVIALGRAFGLRVVAEGVEDPEALQRLRGLGCDLAQGYLLGRPGPEPDLGSRRDAFALASSR